MTVLYQAVASDTGQVYTYSGAYPGTGTATNVIVVAGMGPGAPAAASMGWKTLLDVDFTAETSQALHTDGVTPVIGGVTWTKSGSAKDCSTNPWAIVNGTGLITSSSGSSGDDGFSSTDLSFPTLWPNLALGTLTGISRIPVRMSCVFGLVDNSGAGWGGGTVGLALEARNTSARVIACAPRITFPDLYASETIFNSMNSSVSAINDNAYNTGETPRQNCLMLECPSGLFLGQALHYTAHSADGSFPANPGTDYRCRGVTPNPTVAMSNWNDAPAVWTPNNWRCSIINAMHGAFSTAVIERFKVEAFF